MLKDVAAPKPPIPLPSSSATLLVSKFAVTRSGLLSLLKSPTATENGSEPFPVPKLVARLKLAVAQAATGGAVAVRACA